MFFSPSFFLSTNKPLNPTFAQYKTSSLTCYASLWTGFSLGMILVSNGYATDIKLVHCKLSFMWRRPTRFKTGNQASWLLGFDSLLRSFFLILSNKLGTQYFIYGKTFRDIFVMIFIWFKVILIFDDQKWLCSSNIYSDSDKEKKDNAKVLLQWSCRVTMLQQCSLFLASLAARLFLIHLVQIVGKRKILFSFNIFGLDQ